MLTAESPEDGTQDASLVKYDGITSIIYMYKQVKIFEGRHAHLLKTGKN